MAPALMVCAAHCPWYVGLILFLIGSPFTVAHGTSSVVNLFKDYGWFQMWECCQANSFEEVVHTQEVASYYHILQCCRVWFMSAFRVDGTRSTGRIASRGVHEVVLQPRFDSPSSSGFTAAAVFQNLLLRSSLGLVKH